MSRLPVAAMQRARVGRATLSRSFASAPVSEMRKGHEVDASKVLPLLVESGGLTAQEASAPLDIKQFGHGQSNPTYLLNVGKRPLVLRKQPPGKLLRGAHAVDREFACMSALSSTDVPVPRMLLFVDDAELLGTPFFVCDYVAVRLPGARRTPHWRACAHTYTPQRPSSHAPHE